MKFKEPANKHIHLRVTDELHNHIKEEAINRNMTMTDFVLQTVFLRLDMLSNVLEKNGVCVKK